MKMSKKGWRNGELLPTPKPPLFQVFQEKKCPPQNSDDFFMYPHSWSKCQFHQILIKLSCPPLFGQSIMPHPDLGLHPPLLGYLWHLR